MIGFGILFPDAMLRKSDIWNRRMDVQWEIDPAPFETLKLAYVEQLAFLPGYRYYSSMIATLLACPAFENRCDALLTTTVIHPIKNEAAIPYILAAGGFRAGTIQEFYPKIGEIHSRIYVIVRENFFRAVNSNGVAKRMQSRAYRYFNRLADA